MALVALIISFGILYWLFIIAFWVLSSLAMMRLARRAGKGGIAWFAWIPILAQIQQLRIIGKSGWWVLMYLVPIADLVFAIIWRIQLLNAFGKHGAWVLFYVFIQPVWLIMLMVWGFSNDTRYVGPNAIGM